MSSDIVRELEALDAKATFGPWRWHGRVGGEMWLSTVKGGMVYVLGAERQGMHGATLTLQDHENHIIKKAEAWAVLEAPYRKDVADIDHPDARIIVALRNCLPALIEYVKERTPETEAALLAALRGGK